MSSERIDKRFSKNCFKKIGLIRPCQEKNLELFTKTIMAFEVEEQRRGGRPKCRWKNKLRNEMKEKRLRENQVINKNR